VVRGWEGKAASVSGLILGLNLNHSAKMALASSSSPGRGAGLSFCAPPIRSDWICRKELSIALLATANNRAWGLGIIGAPPGRTLRRR
jgi:hypothetical protein